jgi:hypothetical protein
VVPERRIVTREQKHSMVRAKALQAVHKDHFRMGMLRDSWMYTVQMPGASGTGEIYYVNIEPYLKCDCPDFAKVESRWVKTYTPCKHMYWVLLEHLGWKETDMLIHQPTWSQNNISKIVKGRQPVRGV